ncbi:hypothetical protein BVY01_05185, partial [bacterium I07]
MKSRTGGSKGSGVQNRHQKLKYYTGELGNIVLKKGAPVRFALVYPNHYPVGMASLGFQTVYRMLNEHPEIRCERFFLPSLQGKGRPLSIEKISSIESGAALHEFDIIGFSISFELDIFNVLQILHSSQITLLAKGRSPREPLVIAGGVVTGLNPSPLLPFMDGLLVGEGEGTLNKLADLLFTAKEQYLDRESLLGSLSSLPGFFVPGLSENVDRQITENLDDHPVYTSIVTPDSVFKNMFIMEVGRGCRHSCKFCAACKVYGPYRYRTAHTLLKTVEMYNPGAKRIGLEGSGISDYPELETLWEILLQSGYSVSISSMRADRITENLIDLLEKSDIQTFTIAPEAGSPGLRNYIGKPQNEEGLREAVQRLSRSSVRTLKMYFLIGLPEETDEDVSAIIRLIKTLAEDFKGKGYKRLRVSINAFIPKPFTEFQWAGMARKKQLQSARSRIQRELRNTANVYLTRKNLREEQLQTLLS